MDVIVDGQTNYELEGDPADLLSAVAAVSDYLRQRGRAILSIEVDGETILPDSLVEKFKDQPLGGVGTLEVGSEEIATLVHESLDELKSALPELPTACRTLAEVFQGETPNDGFEPFQELAAIWELVKTREMMIANALGINLDEIELESVAAKTIHEELNEHLEAAVQALKDGDCILLGDLLEYELAPRAERELDIVALLEDRAPAKSG